MDLSLIEATANTAAGVPVPIIVRGTTSGRLTISLGDPGVGLARGSVDVVLRYGTSLRAQGSIRFADGDAIIELRSCPWERGMEATEIRVSLPSANRRARWVAADLEGVDARVTTELSRDVLRTLRRHVPSGLVWTTHVAVDPSLFPWISTGITHRSTRPARRTPWSPIPLVYGLGLTAVLFIAGRTLRSLEGPARIVLPSALLPLPWLLALGAATAHSFAVAGVRGSLSLGTLLLLGAIALCLPSRARGSVTQRRSWAVRVGQVAAIVASAVGFVAGVRASSALAIVLSLDLALILIASVAVSLLRTTAFILPTKVKFQPSAIRSLSLDDVLFSDATADGAREVRSQPSLPQL